MDQMDQDARIIEFVTAVTSAMGLSLTATIVETPDGIRVDLEGEGSDLLVRRRGEALNALQQIVASVFRDEMPEGQRIGVDCLGFRQGKDAELRKMAQFLADKAVTSGAPQEIGPLNPYERRLVHMAVAERADVTSESIGDAFMKTVIIAARK
jgi:spoIIIJ-associated protein